MKSDLGSEDTYQGHSNFAEGGLGSHEWCLQAAQHAAVQQAAAAQAAQAAQAAALPPAAPMAGPSMSPAQVAQQVCPSCACLSRDARTCHYACM